MIEKEKCSVENCSRDSECHYNNLKYCLMHYKQLKRNGRIVDTTYLLKNEFIIYDDYAEIILYNKDYSEKARTIIDVEDIPKLENIKWKYNATTGYVENKDYKIQNVIMNFKSSKFYQIDHINRNKLDNRKINLREATAQENVINRGMQSNNTSGIKGVSWSKKLNKWCANIQFDHIGHNLGCYNDINEAICARQEGELKYFGKINAD